jgi:hypothetical protein
VHVGIEFARADAPRFEDDLAHVALYDLASLPDSLTACPPLGRYSNPPPR